MLHGSRPGDLRARAIRAPRCVRTAIGSCRICRRRAGRSTTLDQRLPVATFAMGVVQATCDAGRAIVSRIGTQVAFCVKRLWELRRNIFVFPEPSRTTQWEGLVMEENPPCSPTLEELRCSGVETIDTFVAAGIDLRTVPLCAVKRVLVHCVRERRRSREADGAPSPGDDDSPWGGASPFVETGSGDRTVY